MKEPNTLPDIQLSLDSRGVDLPWVGVKNVSLPLRLFLSGVELQVGITASLTVGLSAELKGTHMSRLMEILAELSSGRRESLDFSDLLEEACRRLQSGSALLAVSFTHFISKTAPVSGLRSPMGYPCTLVWRYRRGCGHDHGLAVNVPVANLCPCSKAISDYGAHNQRGELRAKCLTASGKALSVSQLENLLLSLEESGSSPVYPLLKRIDEKLITERQYDNPKFVEDVVRDAVGLLRARSELNGFLVEAEAYESIHAHNAWACYEESFSSELFRSC